MNRRLIPPLILAFVSLIIITPLWLASALAEAGLFSFQRAPSGCLNVSGTIITSTWSGCVVVLDSVILSTNSTLTIEHGTVVFFEPDTSLRINGTLQASGYVTSTILFTSNAAFPAPGDWEYILFTNSSGDNLPCDTSGSLMQYTTVEYAGGAAIGDNGAIRIQNSSPCIISNTIQFNSADAIHIWSSTSPYDISPRIRYNTISDNGVAEVSQAAGIYFRSINLNQSVEFTDNQILRNTNRGIYVEVGPDANASIKIEGNLIEQNMSSSSGGGIYLDVRFSAVNQNIIFNNSTEQNGGGIYFHQGPQNTVFVTENIIANNHANNAGGGVYLCNGCNPFIINNDFCANTDDPLYDNDFYNNNSISQPQNITAQNNYWTEGSIFNVESHVYHNIDDSSLSLVDYSNIRTIPLDQTYCPSLTPTPTPTDTPLPTITPTRTNTPTDTPTPTDTLTPTPTDTLTPTSTRTNTPTPTATSTSTSTPTNTPTNTPTPTSTLPPPPVYLPVAVIPAPPTPTPTATPYFFPGPNEVEPNDTSAEANGFLVSGKTYLGLANNGITDIGFRDYYKIDLDVSGQIVIDILNHPLANVTGAQIQLFFETTGNQVAFDVLPPYHIVYNGQPGIYYLYIYNDVSKCTLQGVNCAIPYALTVTFPTP